MPAMSCTIKISRSLASGFTRSCYLSRSNHHPGIRFLIFQSTGTYLAQQCRPHRVHVNGNDHFASDQMAVLLPTRNRVLDCGLLHEVRLRHDWQSQ